jgi:Ca2+-binding EF-hand superfamily protein
MYSVVESLVIVSVMAEKSEEEIKRVFDYLDKNATGSIQLSELATGLRILGANPSQEQVRELTRSIEASSRLEFLEFKRLFRSFKSQDSLSSESIIKYFAEFDPENSGFIDRHELKTALCSFGEKLTDEEAERIFKEFDANSDGKLNYREFAVFLLNS